MPIAIRCACGRSLLAKEEYAGRVTQCPDCERELTIPNPWADGGPARLDFGRLEPANSGKAIGSLLLGLGSFLLFCITGVPAIVVGIIALVEIRRSQGILKGAGLACVGIVLGVIGSGAAVVLGTPAVRSAMEASERAQCVNNLKQIGLAMHNFSSGRPQAPNNTSAILHTAASLHVVGSGQGNLPTVAIMDRKGRPLLSWRVALLQYLGEWDLYRKFKLDEPWDSPHNKALLPLMPEVYACPGSHGPNRKSMTVYQVISGPKTLFDPKGPINFGQITDGTSDTLLVVEGTTATPWTRPDSLPFGPGIPLPVLGGPHGRGWNAVFADGSVRYVKPGLSPTILHGLITRNGGEPIPYDIFGD